MGLLESNTVAAIEEHLIHYGRSKVLVEFEALSLADGHELDDEERVQEAVDTICADKDWTAEIDWINRFVVFVR